MANNENINNPPIMEKNVDSTTKRPNKIFDPYRPLLFPYKNTSFFLRWFLYIISFLFLFLILWASFFEIDEFIRITGKVIPQGKVQEIENKEGGILEAIYVQQGELVVTGQQLMKIENFASRTSQTDHFNRINALKSEITRLEAENKGTSLVFDNQLMENAPEIVASETELFMTRKDNYQASVNTYASQVQQKKDLVKTLQDKLINQQKSLKLITEQYKLFEELAAKKLFTKTRLLEEQKDLNELEGDVQETKMAIVRAKESLNEAKMRLELHEKSYKEAIQEKLNENIEKLKTTEGLYNVEQDITQRSTIVAPTNGVVNQIKVTTIGSTIAPGEKVIEIVPTSKELEIQAFARPRDIAFIKHGQVANVVFTAYDFSIYGGIQGTVKTVGSDALSNKDGTMLYEVIISIPLKHLEKYKNLPVIPGMVAQISTLTDKRTIMSYILKPILRAKYFSLGER